MLIVVVIGIPLLSGTNIIVQKLPMQLEIKRSTNTIYSALTKRNANCQQPRSETVFISEKSKILRYAPRWFAGRESVDFTSRKRWLVKFKFLFFCVCIPLRSSAILCRTFIADAFIL